VFYSFTAIFVLDLVLAVAVRLFEWLLVCVTRVSEKDQIRH